MAGRTRKFEVSEHAVVVILTKLEAKALKTRLLQHTGTKRSLTLQSAETKLDAALMEAE